MLARSAQTARSALNTLFLNIYGYVAGRALPRMDEILRYLLTSQMMVDQGILARCNGDSDLPLTGRQRVSFATTKTKMV